MHSLRADQPACVCACVRTCACRAVYIPSICVSLQLTNSRNCLHSRYMCVLTAQQQSQLFTFIVYVCPYSSTTVATIYIHSICVPLQLNNSQLFTFTVYVCPYSSTTVATVYIHSICVLTAQQQSQLFTFTVYVCPYN